MMDIAIEKKKAFLDEQRKKIALKEKILSEKIRKKQFKYMQEIGRLANKTGIDKLDSEILLGAFLEIAENKNNEENLKNWKLKSSQYTESNNLDEIIPLVIKIKGKIDSTLIVELKKLKFRWNHITKDFFGKGNPQFLEDLLKETDFTISKILD